MGNGLILECALDGDKFPHSLKEVVIASRSRGARNLKLPDAEALGRSNFRLYFILEEIFQADGTFILAGRRKWRPMGKARQKACNAEEKMWSSQELRERALNGLDQIADRLSTTWWPASKLSRDPALDLSAAAVVCACSRSWQRIM